MAGFERTYRFYHAWISDLILKAILGLDDSENTLSAVIPGRKLSACNVVADHCSCKFPASFSFIVNSTYFYTTASDGSGLNGGCESGGSSDGGETMTLAEVRKLIRLVDVEELKKKLRMDRREVIQYSDFLQMCRSMGVAQSLDEVTAFARALDETGVVLLLRDKVHLHPDKVADLVRKAVPLSLTSEDDPRRDELRQLEEKKIEIDRLAHRHVRRILWTGLGLSVMQIGLFFRLTFWEFSWDVMEPIAFFTTTTGIIVGYAYFMVTSRDPTYQDLMKRLFLSRQRKLFKKQNFDVDRYVELQMRCKSPFDISTAIKKSLGMYMEGEAALPHS